MPATPIRTRTAAAALVAATVLGAGAAVAVTAAVVSDDTPSVRQVTVEGAQQTAASSTLSINRVYRLAGPAVVTITTAQTSAAGEQGEGQGSGFVYDREGHIVTNQHVVDGADAVRVTFPNGATHTASVVGSDGSTDIAVIKVDAPASLLKPLVLGDSGAMVVGDTVVAIGSPFGLDQTVTSGIVSALHRQMTAPNDFTINDSIQTDAAINHGNSGGPLLNLRGQVIGVNAQIDTSADRDNAGVGFAIPSNTVRSIADQLIEKGSVQHAYLGVGVQEISESAAEQLDVPAGVALTRITAGEAAAKAGLRASTGSRSVDGRQYPTGGDIVTAIDGQEVNTSAELQSAIDAKRPGDSVELTYTRNGDERTVTVELGIRPARAQ